MLSLFSSLVGVQVIKAQQEVLDSITTRALIVVDDNGNTVATLKKQSDGYGGTFLDIFHDDMPTASIGGGKDGGFVMVFNDEGHRTVSMQNNPGPKPYSPTQGGIAVFDGTSDDTVLLTMANQGGGRIETYNSKGFLTAVITSNDQGHGGLALNRGDLLGSLYSYVLLSVGETGGYSLFSNVENNIIAFLGAGADNSGILQLNNEKGDERAIIGSVDKTGHGGIWLYDRYGDKWRSYTFY